MKRFKPGDEVALRHSIGKVPAGAYGLVVEVYDNKPEAEGDLESLFDYAVVFPTEINKVMTYNGAWLATTISQDQFHAGDAIPVSEDELELHVEGVDLKAYTLIPRDVLAVRWDANTGHEGAKALANWIGGKFTFDEMHPEKTYYWAIELYSHSGYILRLRPGQYVLKYADGEIRSMNADTFISTYEALEK